MAFLFGIAALLYSMAGHGGASAYLALGLMTGSAPAEARANALALNLIVAGIAALAFWSAGHLRWRKLLPLAAGSIPLAFFGAQQSLHSPYLKPALGVAMLWAAWRFTFGADSGMERASRQAPGALLLLAAGAGLGWLSGWTGVGGGIYLSPLLLWMGWANAKESAALAAAFIWLNSVAGLAGAGMAPSLRPEWVAACLVGAVLGSLLGAFKLSPVALRRALGLVLLVAAAKALGI